jgi:hypothetical protein
MELANILIDQVKEIKEVPLPIWILFLLGSIADNSVFMDSWGQNAI